VWPRSQFGHVTVRNAWCHDCHITLLLHFIVIILFFIDMLFTCLCSLFLSLFTAASVILLALSIDILLTLLVQHRKRSWKLPHLTLSLPVEETPSNFVIKLSTLKDERHFSTFRQHLSYGDCLEVKREYYQNCSVLNCVKRCSQSAAYLCEQFLQVQQIGFVT